MSVKLYSTIARIMQVPVSEINDTSGPETIERWDSFQRLILLEDLETTFGIRFTLDEVISIKTVADIKRNLLNHGVMLDE
jgi:acyl carrier protein